MLKISELILECQSAATEDSVLKNFLFVCTGNTCRSPMAEAVFKHLAGEKVNAQSAGLFAMHGSPANEKTVKVLSDKNIPVSHQSQPVTAELLEWADFVLTMTEDHKQAINQRYTTYAKKVFTLKEYVSVIEGTDEVWDKDIIDPYGGSTQAYQQTFDELIQLLHKINNHITNN